MTGISVWIMSTVMGILVVLWVRDRRRFSEKLQDLSRQQSQSRRTLNDSISETRKIVQEFSRLLPQNPLATPFTKNPADEGGSEFRYATIEKRHLVLTLSRKGHTTKEIAERLLLPSGEVELILNLHQDSRTKVPA